MKKFIIIFTISKELYEIIESSKIDLTKDHKVVAESDNENELKPLLKELIEADKLAREAEKEINKLKGKTEPEPKIKEKYCIVSNGNNSFVIIETINYDREKNGPMIDKGSLNKMQIALGHRPQ